MSDYDVAAVLELDRVRTDVEDAERFVRRIERYLQEGGWL